MVQPFLERGRILHADLDRRQHLVPTSWCRQIKGRCDFPHIAHDRFLTLRHVHGKSPKQRRPDSNGKVTHPGHRQIGEDFLVLVEGARSMAIPRRRENVLLAQHDTFRFAGRSRRVHENRRVFGLRPVQNGLAAARIPVKFALTDLDQVIP